MDEILNFISRNNKGDQSIENLVAIAIETSNKALSEISSHTKSCDGRYANLEQRFQDQSDRIDKLTNILWATAGGVIMVLLATSGTLAMIVLKH